MRFHNTGLSVAVVIPTRNRHEELLECIDSVLRQTMLPNELIVVDGGDLPEREFFDLLLPKIPHKMKVHYLHTTPGLTHQRNVAIDACEKEIIIFLDDDVVLDTNFIAEILKIFSVDRHRLIGGVTGRLVEVNPPPAEINSLFLKGFKKILHQAFVLFFFLPIDHGDGRYRLSGMYTECNHIKDHILRIDALAGGCVGYRREVFSTIRFDEKLTDYAWGEDDDVSIQVSKKYITLYTPFAVAFHKNSSKGRCSRYERSRMVIRNHHYLFLKNFSQTPVAKFAHFLSILGLLIEELSQSMLHRDNSGIRGTIDGIKLILKKIPLESTKIQVIERKIL